MSSIFKGLFGGKSSAEGVLQKFNPAGFTSGGSFGDFNANTNRFQLTRTNEGKQGVEGIVQASQKRESAFKGLADRVKPGFGEVTRTRVDAIRRAGTKAVGNLREELSKRRVAGSSFAQNQVAGVEAEFGKLEEQARSEAKLQELGATAEFINESTAAAIEGATAVLAQLNFETSVAAGLSEAASAQNNANITAQAEARSAQEQGAGEFIGSLIQFAQE